MIADDIKETTNQIKTFKAFALKIGRTTLWLTFGSLLLSSDSPLEESDLNFCLGAIVNSPNFQFTLNYLKLALNANQTKFAFSLFLKHQEEVLT